MKKNYRFSQTEKNLTQVTDRYFSESIISTRASLVWRGRNIYTAWPTMKIPKHIFEARKVVTSERTIIFLRKRSYSFLGYQFYLIDPF